MQQRQVVFDRDACRPDERQRLGGCDVGATGEVDRADQRAGDGIVHRRRGATPRLNDAREVLRAADLQLGVEGERRAGRVRSGPALTPVRAWHEVHRLGFADRIAIALDPEQRAVGRGHRDDDAGVGRVLDQQPTDDRKRRRQRVGGAHVVEGDGDGCRLRSAAVGVDASGQAAAPAVGDDGAQRGGVEVRGIQLACDEEFVNDAHIRQPSRSPAA